MSKIRTVLIANRGEIALRIHRTLKVNNMRSVVVFHAVDARSPAVLEADEAIEIKGTTPVAAYLDIEQIVAACRATGADALHPGYGFLAENAALARALEHADVIFIGPTADVMELMGDKVRARNFVAARGFPVAPSAIEDDDPSTFVERAHTVGTPLVVKPSAGGGGKGMRIVRDMSLLQLEIESARREGERYFSDGRLFVERYIERPRHIEVQVMGDLHGNCVHFGERECSVQRRFQKIIEETPSPALSPEQRQTICQTAVGIAKAANYRGAGTVEFIYAQDGGYYFLEMNTRLQVEHPVTEMVTGFDLVHEQLRVASGEALGYQQRDIASIGHSIECRLYAEDADHDYRPMTGDVLRWRPPAGPGIRVDAGIREGQTVTAFFDPMLAKIVTHGNNRAQAIARAKRALSDCVLLGVTTNTRHLVRILEHPEFVAGAVDTGFLARHADALKTVTPDASLVLLLGAAALADRMCARMLAETPSLHAAIGAWRN